MIKAFSFHFFQKASSYIEFEESQLRSSERLRHASLVATTEPFPDRRLETLRSLAHQKPRSNRLVLQSFAIAIGLLTIAGCGGGWQGARSLLPEITVQPISQTATVGQAATFAVSATSSAPVSYQWNKGGAPISGATASSYTTPSTTTADNGSTFTATVSNVIGSVTTAPATLTVAPATAPPSAPAITAQPVNQTVTAGQAATFAVVASGNALVEKICRQ